MGEFGEGGALFCKHGGNYKAAVGFSEEYELIGQYQFDVLQELGLQKRHRLLDIACGSLRLGRLLIPWLWKGRYHGIEPNAWLIDAGLKNELPENIMTTKEPRFSFASDFSIHPGLIHATPGFDFVVAHDVFTNTGIGQMISCLKAVRKNLKDSGIFAVTVMFGSKSDYDENTWRYHSFARYTIASFVALAREIGFNVEIKGHAGIFNHPSDRTWVVLRKPQGGHYDNISRSRYNR